MRSDVLSRASKEASRQRRVTLYAAIAIIVVGLLALVVVRYFSATTSKPSQLSAEAAVVVSPEESAGLRDKFKQALKYYESELESQLLLANLPAWNQQAENEVRKWKEQALSSFAHGDYTVALTALGQASRSAIHVLQEWQDRYTAAYAKALEFFDEALADSANLSIDEALKLKPSEPEALILEQRINVLPRVNKLFAEATTAKIENNMRKQLGSLRKILAIDPLRVEVKQNITRLAGKIAEQDFASFVDAGLKAVDSNKLNEARSALRRAKAIFSSRRESQILSQRILQLSSRRVLSNALKKGDGAAKLDNWSLALHTYQEALKIHPDNAQLIAKELRAKKIVSFSEAIADYLRQPQRLASENIVLGAKKTLAEANQFLAMSKSLELMVSELANTLVKYSHPTEVVIRSNNQTYLTIRGVGKIGMVSEKIISLKPGKYVLEGKRSGYKSKLLSLNISPDQSPLNIILLCDEPI